MICVSIRKLRFLIYRRGFSETPRAFRKRPGRFLNSSAAGNLHKLRFQYVFDAFSLGVRKKSGVVAGAGVNHPQSTLTSDAEQQLMPKESSGGPFGGPSGGPSGGLSVGTSAGPAGESPENLLKIFLEILVEILPKGLSLLDV